MKLQNSIILSIVLVVAISLIVANTHAFAESQKASTVKQIKAKVKQNATDNDTDVSLKDLYKQRADLGKAKASMSAAEFRQRYDALQDQIEAAEQKKNNVVAPPVVQPSSCSNGQVMDSFGNCVTPELKKTMQLKSQKGVNPETIDDIQKLKQENTLLKNRVSALESKILALEQIINQLKAAVGLN